MACEPLSCEAVGSDEGRDWSLQLKQKQVHRDSLQDGVIAQQSETEKSCKSKCLSTAWLKHTALLCWAMGEGGVRRNIHPSEGKRAWSCGYLPLTSKSRRRSELEE